MKLLIALTVILSVAAGADQVIIGDQDFSIKSPYCGS